MHLLDGTEYGSIEVRPAPLLCVPLTGPSRGWMSVRYQCQPFFCLVGFASFSPLVWFSFVCVHIVFFEEFQHYNNNFDFCIIQLNSRGAVIELEIGPTLFLPSVKSV